MVIRLEGGADLHIAQMMMPLPLTVSCFSKIQIGFTSLVLAYPGSSGKRPLNECVLSAHKHTCMKRFVQNCPDLRMAQCSWHLQAYKSTNNIYSHVHILNPRYLDNCSQSGI